MSCIHITACQFACTPSAFPGQGFQLSKAYTCTSTYLRTKLPEISLKTTSATSRYREAATICLFGGKGKPENGDEAAPWKAVEKAAGNFMKNQSIEDVLKQQIQEQEYFEDGGSGGEGPGGGGGDGSGSDSGSGDGDGEADYSGGWEEFVQVTLATFGIIFVYVYLLNYQEIHVYTKDIIRYFFTKQMSIRLGRLTAGLQYELKRMKQKKLPDDPYWLERAIMRTRTRYDSPAKYKKMLRASKS